MKYGRVDGIFFSPGTGSDFGGRPTANLSHLQVKIPLIGAQVSNRVARLSH